MSGDGNTLATGAISERSAATGINGNQADKSADGAGAVYVYVRAGGKWSQQAYVKPWNTTARGGLFGYSVGLSGNGDTMAVGAYDEERGKGAAYIFTRTGGNWAQQIRLMASNAEDGDSLGCSIAISDDGNTMAAGAFDEDSLLRGIQPPTEGSNDAASDVSTGAAYVFVRTGSAWTQQAFVKATNTRLNDQFAWALSLSRDGNTLAVGSHLEDSGASGLNGNQEDATAEDAGAVYVYARSGTTWAPASYVKASSPRASAEFGISVALNGDGKVLAVGAFKDSGGGAGINPRSNREDRRRIRSGVCLLLKPGGKRECDNILFFTVERFGSSGCVKSCGCSTECARSRSRSCRSRRPAPGLRGPPPPMRLVSTDISDGKPIRRKVYVRRGGGCHLPGVAMDAAAARHGKLRADRA